MGLRLHLPCRLPGLADARAAQRLVLRRFVGIDALTVARTRFSEYLTGTMVRRSRHSKIRFDIFLNHEALEAHEDFG